MITVKNIEEFNIGDNISQSRNIYTVLSKDDSNQRVKVEHSIGFTCEFEYGSQFVLVKEGNK